MRIKWSAVVLVLVAIGVVSCSGDPEAAKRRYVAAGDRYMAEQKYQEAVLQYRNAVKQDSKFGEGRSKLAGAYVAIGDARNALREAVRAADLMPGNIDAQLQAGSILFMARQYPETRARAQAVLDKDPKNARALVLLGNALAGLKDLDAAIEQVEQAIDEDPQLTLSYANLGAMYIAKGDREAAEATFKRAVAAAPDSELAHLSLANFFWAIGKREDAEREIKIALDIEPKSATANRALATLYVIQNRATEAEPYLKAYADASGNTESRLVLADYYVRSRNVPEATKVLTALANEKDGFVPATIRLAVLDFTGDRRPQAHERLEQILERHPDNTSTLEAKARFFLFEGRQGEALTLTEALLKASPKSLSTQYLRGLALEATGSIDEAVNLFQGMLGSGSSSVAIQTKLATLYLDQRKFKEALTLAQQVVKARPRAVAAHFLYARALVKSGDLVNAERELLALQKVASSSPEVHTWLGFLYEAKRDVTGARRSFEKALDLQPEATAALAGLVSADLAEKKPAAALARIASRLADHPNDVRLVTMSAMAHLAVGDLPKAEAAYRKLVELDPNNLDAYNRLGSIYLAQGRLDEARKTFEELLRNQGNPVLAETMIGTILLWQNKPQEARTHFERAVEVNSRAAVAANNLAWDYANNGGNLDIALQLAQTAKAELPDVASITDTLGWVYYKKGLNSLAVSTFQEAAKQDPSNPRIQHRLGLAYLQNGNRDEAKSTLQRVLKLNLSVEDAKEVRRVLSAIQS